MSKLPEKCIGYGVTEYQCTNPTGKISGLGRKNLYWCPDCDEVRIAAIGSQLDGLLDDLVTKK